MPLLHLWPPCLPGSLVLCHQCICKAACMHTSLVIKNPFKRDPLKVKCAPMLGICLTAPQIKQACSLVNTQQTGLVGKGFKMSCDKILTIHLLQQSVSMTGHTFPTKFKTIMQINLCIKWLMRGNIQHVQEKCPKNLCINCKICYLFSLLGRR